MTSVYSCCFVTLTCLDVLVATDEQTDQRQEMSQSIQKCAALVIKLKAC